MTADLSVLMSLYAKEKPEYVEACFQSLIQQTVKASEWVIVEDGPLTNELYSLLDFYEDKFPGLIKRVPLKSNRGLGLALRAGVPVCKNNLIARMDTDDISRKDRFQKQLSVFKRNPKLDICGSYISEFEGNPQNIVSQRRVPINEKQIRKYQKRRDAFNHMSVMYKKKAVLDAGNYQDCPLMEDSLLWVHMLQNKARCVNIPEPLVNARIGHEMYERRGGIGYLKKYFKGRKRILETGYISLVDFIYTMLVQIVVALSPSKIRGLVFKKVLHNSN